MKHSVLFAAAIAATALFASCQKERAIAPGGMVSMTVGVDVEEPQDVKTTLSGTTILWGENEYATLYFNDGAPHFVKSQASSASRGNGKASTSFDFNFTAGSASSYVLGGVYPSSAVTGQASEDCEVTLPADQKATASAYDPAAFILVMKSETVSEVPSTWTSKFRRAVALNKVTLTGTKEAITKVEITAAGKSLAGSRIINMASSQSKSMVKSAATVGVSYATALPAGNIDVWFTSWGTTIAAGETMTITACSASGTYTKTITAKGSGISFKEGGLNTLTVDFSGVALKSYSLKDFAQSFTTLLDVWENNTAKDLKVGNFTISGKYIPAATKISVGASTYDKTTAYGIALAAFQGLAAGTLTMTSAIPASPGSYAWGADPYNEGEGNGGEFGNATVSYDFLRNYASRELAWVASNSAWCNFCTYTDADGNVSTKGTPQVTGYKGVCCLERNLLMMARFFKYVLDNNITTNVATACASVAISSDLFSTNNLSLSPASVKFASSASSTKVTVTTTAAWTATASASWITVSPASGTGTASVTVSAAANTASSARSGKVTFKVGGESVEFAVSQDAAGAATLKTFAEQFVGILTTWQKTTGSVTVTSGSTFSNVHYVPANTTITVGGTSYNKAKMYSIALQGFNALYSGGKLTDGIPTPANYTWGDNPYNEEAGNGGAFQNATVTLDFLRNFASRELPYGASNNRWSNFCTYTDADGNVSTKGTPQVTGFKGVCCLERNLLMMARFYKHLLDNNITSGIATSCASISIDASLYELKTISVSAASASVAATASTAKVNVTCSATWTGKSSATWLTISPASGNAGTTAVTASAAANTGTASRSATVTFTSSAGDAVTYKVTQAAPVATTTLKEFATAFKGILSTWKSNSSTSVKVGDVTMAGHYIPASTKITVGSKSYNKAQMFSIAVQGLLMFVDGKGLNDAMPEPGSYTWGANPYLESTAFSNQTVKLAFLRNMATRQKNYAASNSNTWANFCSYDGNATTTGTPSVSGYTGNCSLDRSLLMLARYYKYLLDKSITTNILSSTGSVAIAAGLYKTISLAASSASIGNAATTKSVKLTVGLTGGASWTAKSSATWLTVSPTSGTATTTLSIAATKNTASSSRSATITVTSPEGDTATYKVTQSGATTTYSSPWTQSGIHTEKKPGYLGQINGYTCGPHSLMQCIYKITKVDMAEKTLASWAGTTTSGTGHDGLATALSKFNSSKGYSLKMTWYNFSDCTTAQIGNWMANPNTAIFFHLYYRNQYGHYELPYKITSGASTLQVANSLGDYYNGSNSSGGYYGYIETRTWANQKSYISGISQKSVCVISK